MQQPEHRTSDHKPLSRAQPPRRQRGIIVVATTVAMFALLMVAGYSINSGHILLNKTRLQNIVDTAALTAAKVLDQSQDTLQAEQAGFQSLLTNLAASGYEELAASINNSGIAFIAEFSNTLVPFDPISAAPRFVRISLSANVPLSDFLLVTNKAVNATAVSGPSPILAGSACDIVPLMACGENELVCDDDGVCSNYYGYSPNDIIVMKMAAGDESEVGAGNFQLIRLPDGQGGAAVRENLAGGYSECITTSEPLETEPGNSVGPVVQGINMRFGSAGGPLDADTYQADHVTDIGDTISLNDDGSLNIPDDIFDYYDYDNKYQTYPVGQTYASSCPGSGQCYRRKLTIAIGQCDGTTNGQGTIDPVYGFGCFFLLQPVQQKGTEAQIFGQFVQGCTNYGSFTQTPGVGPAPTRIILYKNPDSVDA